MLKEVKNKWATEYPTMSKCLRMIFNFKQPGFDPQWQQNDVSLEQALQIVFPKSFLRVLLGSWGEATQALVAIIKANRDYV